jgi:hypothetical protein
MLDAHLSTEVREFVCVMEIAGFCVSSPAYMFVVMLLLNTLKYLLTRRKVSAGGARRGGRGVGLTRLTGTARDAAGLRSRRRRHPRPRLRQLPACLPACPPGSKPCAPRPPRRTAMCSCTRCG